MKARIRGTEIWFDIDGAGLVPDGPRMVERPVMFALHGGPGGDHTYYKPALDPLTDRFQIVYVDHRGQGRSGRGPRGLRKYSSPMRNFVGHDIPFALGGFGDGDEVRADEQRLDPRDVEQAFRQR